jgi:hypothetical protein
LRKPARESGADPAPVVIPFGHCRFETPTARPRLPTPTDVDLFRMCFDNLLDQRHERVRLVALIDWNRFDEAFGPFSGDRVGRADLPTRPMAGLHLSQYMTGLPDEQVCAQWVENPTSCLLRRGALPPRPAARPLADARSAQAHRARDVGNAAGGDHRRGGEDQGGERTRDRAPFIPASAGNTQTNKL